MEYKRQCKTCGHVFCFTDEDLVKSNRANNLSALSAIGAMAGALSGNWMAARVNQADMHEHESKVLDFNHCPNCRSTDLIYLSDKDFDEIRAKSEVATTKPSITINSNASIESIIKRIEIFIQEEEWDKAEAYCEQALDMDPENGLIYYYELLVSERAHDEDSLANTPSIRDNKNYRLARKYGDSDIQVKLDKTEQIIKDLEKKAERKRQEEIAVRKKREEEIEEAKRTEKYNKAISTIDNKSKSIKDLSEALSILHELQNWKDVSSDIDKCNKLIKLSQNTAKKKRSIGIAVAVIICIFIILYLFVFAPLISYYRVKDCIAKENYEKANELLLEMENYKYFDSLTEEAKNEYAESAIETGKSYINDGKYAEAKVLLDGINGPKKADAQDLLALLNYKWGIELFETKDYLNAKLRLKQAISKYPDAKEYYYYTIICEGVNELNNLANNQPYGDTAELMNAVVFFKDHKGFMDADSLISSCEVIERVLSLNGEWVEGQDNKITFNNGEWMSEEGLSTRNGSIKIVNSNGRYLLYDYYYPDNPSDYHFIGYSKGENTLRLYARKYTRE